MGLLYLIRISDKLGIDLIAAAKAKIELNAANYLVQPVEKARGSSKKYTALLRGIRARHQARV